MEDSNIIPVIPTGYGEECQPEGWFSNFWYASLSQVKFFNIPALIMSTRDLVVEPDVTAQVLGQRVAKIGDDVQQELQLEAARRAGGQEAQPDVAQAVATPQGWSSLIEVIQQQIQKFNLD